MAKYDEGLGYEIVKAVQIGEISEPITFEKVKQFCDNKGLKSTENYMRVILSNSTKNTHSPTYIKYFERVGRGEYVLHPDYRKLTQYYWLNVDSKSYEWSFSNLKIGGSQTYSNKNDDGGKRKNEGCFQNIKIGDKVLAYETGVTKAVTTICEVINKYEENDKLVVEFQKMRNFNKFLSLETMKRSESLNDCDIVQIHRGTLFELEKKHYNEILQLLESINAQMDYFEELDIAVKELRKLNSSERKKQIERRTDNIPEKFDRIVSEFRRNPYVIAEVLERANGVCEKCGKSAPFIRVSDGSHYLEVHHKIRLADGGEDTLINAIAACPNCHRELHFGVTN